MNETKQQDATSGSLSGIVQLSHGLVHCNVVGCEDMAIFKWSFKNETEDHLQLLSPQENIVNFMGNGTYFAEVFCGGKKILLTNTFSDTVIEHVPEVVRQVVKSDPVSFEWDFTKIPKKEKPNIRKLYKAEKWKDLALLHNRYAVSQNGYCCDMTGIKVNFAKYLGYDK